MSEGKAAESCGVGEYGNALDGVAIVSVAAREAESQYIGSLARL